MEENEEMSGGTMENKKHKLRRMSSRTSITSVISAAEPSPKTLRRNNSKKWVDQVENVRSICIINSVKTLFEITLLFSKLGRASFILLANCDGQGWYCNWQTMLSSATRKPCFRMFWPRFVMHSIAFGATPRTTDTRYKKKMYNITRAGLCIWLAVLFFLRLNSENHVISSFIDSETC